MKISRFDQANKLRVPTDWTSLEAFTEWYVAAGCPFRPPADAQVLCSEYSFNTTIFRQGQYQVELYLIRPDTVTPEHSHPFDQQTIFLSGQLWGTRQGTDGIIGHSGNVERRHRHNPNLAHPDSHNIGAVLPTDHWHKLSVGPEGATILVAEHWAAGRTPTSAIIEWAGPSLGPDHDERLKLRKIVA